MPIDARGNPVPEGETPETVIEVWQIEPQPSIGEYDFYVIRDYHEAGEFADTALEQVMDQVDVGRKASVTVGIVKMTLAEYETICGQREPEF